MNLIILEEHTYCSYPISSNDNLQERASCSLSLVKVLIVCCSIEQGDDTVQHGLSPCLKPRLVEAISIKDRLTERGSLPEHGVRFRVGTGRDGK